jgi:hypothetical protein
VPGGMVLCAACTVPTPERQRTKTKTPANSLQMPPITDYYMRQAL